MHQYFQELFVAFLTLRDEQYDKFLFNKLQYAFVINDNKLLYFFLQF